MVAYVTPPGFPLGQLQTHKRVLGAWGGWLREGKVLDFARGNHGTLVGSPALVNTPGGRAWQGNGSSTRISVNSAILTGYNFSLCIYGVYLAGQTSCSLTFTDSTSATQIIQINIQPTGLARLQATNGANTAIMDGVTTLAGGQVFTMVGNFLSTTSRELYLYGLLEASNTTSVPFPTLNAANLLALVRTTTSWHYGSILLAMVVSPALTAAEIKAFVIDPWFMARARRGDLWAAFTTPPAGAPNRQRVFVF